MKKIIFCIIVFVLVTVGLAAAGEQKVSVEILYMNHGPLLSTLQDIDNACAQYKDKITVSRYDFDSPEGEKFKNKKGITQHVPLIIWIAGKNSVSIKGKEISLTVFMPDRVLLFFRENGLWKICAVR